MRTDLPTGTVTFFFSDIEGSTRLAQRMGSSFRQLIDEHNAIVRSVVGPSGAAEVRTVGDSFFLVFTDPATAVRTAIRIQQELEEHHWPEEAAVRVRIGLHTGKGELGGDDYVGLDVHRAARIADAGHGGQVLVSEETRLLADGDAFEFRDLGVHRLKDLEQSQRLSQVVVPSLPAEFPPLRTVATRLNNLPASTTALVGREADIAAIGRVLDDHRVVTLLGPGGVGKTRLAIAAASDQLERFADGVAFVDLSAVSDADLVPGAIADALRLEESSLEAALEYLARLELLLVLDNFEQVLQAAASVWVLLEGSPKLSTLITSQAPLNLPGEQRYLVGPLMSDDGRGSGVELFMARAHEIDPTFDGDPSSVARIVEALDGLPLAVELAASRAHVLPLDEITARVEDPSFLVRSGALSDRHRSVTAALWWSHDLLSPGDQIAFRRLGVFSGGLTVTAAEAVIGRDGAADPLQSISELLDRSLLNRAADGSGRLAMLDGVRRFAVERLTDSNDTTAIQRHTDWFCSLAAEGERGVRADRAKWWRARLQSELANLRAVLERLLVAGDADRGLTLLGDMWRFMQSAGHLIELDRWLDRFFELPEADEHTVGRAKGLMARAAVRYWRSEAQPAIANYEEAVAIARRLGDDWLVAEALFGLGTSHNVAQREDDAIVALEEAERLYLASGDVGAHADVLGAKLYYRILKTGPIGLDSEFQVIERMQRNAGRITQVVHAIFARAGLAVAEHRNLDARETALEGLVLAEELADRHLVAWGLEWQAMAEVELGEVARAGMLIGAGERARRTHGGGWSPAVLGIDDAPTRLRAAIGEQAAEEAIAAGRGLSLETALDVARRH